MQIEETISITEAAKLKGVRRQSIFNAIEAGKIRIVGNHAGRKLLNRADVEKYKPRAKRGKEDAKGTDD